MLVGKIKTNKKYLGRMLTKWVVIYGKLRIGKQNELLFMEIYESITKSLTDLSFMYRQILVIIKVECGGPGNPCYDW